MRTLRLAMHTCSCLPHRDRCATDRSTGFCLRDARVVGLAAGAVRIVRTLTPVELDLVQQPAINGPVLLFAIGTTVITGVLFGLLPSLQLGNPNLRGALTDGGKSTTAGMSSGRLRNALVAAELGLAVVLVVGAGLLVRSFSILT